MMNQYIKELEQGAFDSDEFVERLAWRTLKECGDANQFDPDLIIETFTEAIKNLSVLMERQERKDLRFEQAVKDEEALHSTKVIQLQGHHKQSVSVFSELDERISWAGGRALQIGEQLGAAQRPRARIAAAHSLISLFADFLSPGPVQSDIFNDPSKIDEAADMIQKLYMITQDMPPGKFEAATKKIEAKYDEIERSLIEEFVRAQIAGNAIRMQEIATILINFKGYSQCIDAFIETSQMNSFTGRDIFPGILPLCESNYLIIKSVFSNPDQVMSKFILNIFHLKLQKYIQTKLADKSDLDKYLKNLYEMYTNTQKVCEQLSSLGDVAASGLLSRVGAVNGAVGKPLETYFPLELQRLRNTFANALQRYYASRQHTRRQIQTGGFQELRRDLQAVIGTRANINIAQIENYGGETFLSEELATQMLQEAKTSFVRCKVLSPPSELPSNATLLTEAVVQHLLVEHCDYAVDLGLQSVPIAENKTSPKIHFFDVVKQCNAIVHMFNKHFQEHVMPSVGNTSKQADCMQKKNVVLEQLESKLDTGLERSLTSIIGWVKIYLATEQKKSDFRPEGDVDTLASSACLVVVSYLNTTLTRLRDCLDGENLIAVTQELGIRLHRVVYEHLMTFQFNSAGAMCAICDVNEYRKLMSSPSIPPLIGELFNTLHALCNLLLVKPENLQQVCEGETLAELDRSILLNFVQLRSDYKTKRLAVLLKGLAA